MFPNPEHADEHGILAVGGDLRPETLLQAYSQGIFPWPIEGLGLAWFSPDPRAILDFSDIHLPRSLKKVVNKRSYEATIDRNFGAVIAACAAQPRPGQEGTWITPGLRRAYEKLHELGIAHSVEIWQDGVIVGGVYGVAVRGVFSAESMFYKKPNASKLAVLHLIDYLADKGGTWLDIQVMTPHMERFGAKDVPRREFLRRLNKAHAQNLRLF